MFCFFLCSAWPKHVPLRICCYFRIFIIACAKCQHFLLHQTSLKKSACSRSLKHLMVWFYYSIRNIESRASAVHQLNTTAQKYQEHVQVDLKTLSPMKSFCTWGLQRVVAMLVALWDNSLPIQGISLTDAHIHDPQWTNPSVVVWQLPLLHTRG